MLKFQLCADEIPSPPGVALRLLEIFDDPDVTTDQFAHVISADPALTVKIIDYCNSPIIGLPRKTTNLNQAVVLLGLRTVKMIALSFSLIQTRADEDNGFDYNMFWNRSLATALVAKKLVDHQGANGDDAFLVGLMLNIGEIAMAHSHLAEYQTLLEQALDQDEIPQNLAIIDLEREKWGTDHYAIGGELLQQWNFPQSVSEFIAQYGSTIQENRIELAKTLCLAEQLARMLFDDNYSTNDVTRLRDESMELLTVDEAEYNALFENIMLDWAEYAKLLNLETSEVANFQELENRALRKISRMSLGLDQENRMMQEENDELKSKVLIDSLTGLKNRAAYDAEVAAELERVRRNNGECSLALIDIDYFKSVNDTYGHAAGDAILTSVANRMRSNLRPYDTLYRFGGEEFAVLLHCDHEVTCSIIERLREAVEEMTVSFQGQRINVTISVGAACLMPNSICSLEKLFEVADGLLYRAKNEGRNRCIALTVANIPITTDNLLTSPNMTTPTPPN